MEQRISVRGLVEFILRHGDIDNRKTAATDDAMQAGSRIHRLIQARMGTEYRAEYPLTYGFDTKLTHVTLEGRADGIITLTDKVIVDEIKGTYKHLDRIEEPEILHLAQAKCYAAIYLMQENLPKISVRITYANLESEEIKYLQSEYTASEIVTWFNELCAEYGKWADLRAKWYIKRQESIKNLEFPYAYRPGQRDLVGHVYRTIYHGRKLFIEAPTGTGKTLSTLFPAIRSMGEGRGDRIFYLTARTIARTVAQEGMSILRENGLVARDITLTAKEKICFMEKSECYPEYCPYAKGHLDRINECLYDLVVNESALTREIIEEYANKYMVCPFELSLDASLFADCIICDYNYVFDPNAYLRRFFAEGICGDYLFLVDEAHNLVDRGREMYSAVIVKEDLLKAKNACKDPLPRIAAAIGKCNTDMLNLKRMGGGELCVESTASISALIGHVDRLYTLISEYLADHVDGEAHDEVLDLFFKLKNFLLIYDLMRGNYVCYTDYTAEDEFFLKLFNVDPALNLADCMNRARSTILFSATLLPIQYYKSLLGGRSEDYEVYSQSIFDPAKRLLVQAMDVSSKYTDRTPKLYKKIADYISRIVREKEGNYIVFAPSYSFMYDVYSSYMENFYDRDTQEVLCQTTQMREKDKEEFLNRFVGSKDCDLQTLTELINADIEVEEKSLIGFCVLGGVFSEGIDLKSDALIGVIIIGTGLPQMGGELDLLKDYFNQNGVNGFDYAYRFPGMNKVQQAAGRLIRTESDVGVIALLDDRYSHASNKRLLPREWSDMTGVSIDNISKMVSNFWKNNE